MIDTQPLTAEQLIDQIKLFADKYGYDKPVLIFNPYTNLIHPIWSCGLRANPENDQDRPNIIVGIGSEGEPA